MKHSNILCNQDSGGFIIKGSTSLKSWIGLFERKSICYFISRKKCQHDKRVYCSSRYHRINEGMDVRQRMIVSRVPRQFIAACVFSVKTPFGNYKSRIHVIFFYRHVNKRVSWKNYPSNVAMHRLISKENLLVSLYYIMYYWFNIQLIHFT